MKTLRECGPKMSCEGRSSAEREWVEAVTVEWDDGHVPEPLKGARDESSSSRLTFYPDFHGGAAAMNGRVFFVDDAVDPALVGALYETTVNNSEAPSWGTYVTMEQVQTFWKEEGTPVDVPSSTKTRRRRRRDDLALAAVSAFLRHAMNHHNGSSSDDDAPPPLWTDNDCNKAHGVAVWALAADAGSHVPYHVDHAELVRYETGVTVLPALAGTLQCSPVVAMAGGDLCVCAAGLRHYRRHGYKGALSGRRRTGEESGSQDDSSWMLLLPEDAGDWVRIPYKYNRMICQSGHLPHFSTTVESMCPLGDRSSADSDLKRVIVGFNVFTHDVGPAIQQAPEHSEAFRKRVVAAQRQRQQQLKQRMKQQHQQLSVQDVRSNPRLARLLVLAKREKVKQELKEAQQELDRHIQAYLDKVSEQPEGTPSVTLRQDLVTRLACTDGKWPSADDVQVHLRHRWHHDERLFPK